MSVNTATDESVSTDEQPDDNDDLLFAGGFTVPGVDEAELQEQYNQEQSALLGVDAEGAIHEVVQDRYGRRVLVSDPDGELHEVDATGRGPGEYVAFIVEDRGGWEALDDGAAAAARAQYGVEPLAANRGDGQ